MARFTLAVFCLQVLQVIATPDSPDTVRGFLKTLEQSSTTKTTKLYDAPTSNITFDNALILESTAREHARQLAERPAFAFRPHDSKEFKQMAMSLPALHASDHVYKRVQDNAARLREPPPPPSKHQRRQGGLNVMIVGDSMSQGMQGDYTWRYRMWQWFQSNNVVVNFVGPYRGTRQPDPPNPGPPQPPSANPPSNTDVLNVDGAYSTGTSAGWPSYHFSVWGRAAAVDKGLIQSVVSQNPTDLMLLMLGFNDMGWFYSDAYGTLDSIHTLITNARAANPNIKIAVANVVQRTFIGGRQDLVDNTNLYNSLLANAVPQWTTSQSPISLVHLQENYDCGPSSCPAGSDGLHPNELGEYQIARAFSLSLFNDFHLGSGPLTVPSSIPARPLPVPSNFQVFSSPQGVTATWDPVFGAYNYDVQQTLNGGTLYDFSPGLVLSNRWDSRWPLDGEVYNVMVRAAAGDTRKGSWTGAQTATAHPQLAAPPQNVKVTPSSSGVDISWSPPTGAYSDSIVEYNIIWWDLDSCNFLANSVFTSSPGYVHNLPTGHRIFTVIEVWNANGGGFPNVDNLAKPGLGTPGAPTNLVVTSLDQTSIQLNVDAISAASGYYMWLRNVNQTGSVSQRQNGTSDVPCFQTYFLYPGVWNYEFCVSAYNGNLEGPKGQCIVAASPTATRAANCPTAPGWCANGPGSGSSGGSGGSGGSGSNPSGTTTNTAPATSSSAAGGLGPAPPDNAPYPTVTNGQCKGPDCKNGQCVGVLCVSFGCKGSKCSNGVCTGGDCVVGGCIGGGCVNGFCNELGCITEGCIGPQCGSSGVCTGLNCISVGCIGPSCDPSTGLCKDSSCSEGWCHGLGCANGVCQSSCSDNGIDAGGSGPTNVPTVTPTPSSSTTRPTSCTSTKTVSNCAVTCDIILGDEPHTTSCDPTSCSGTQTGCSLTGSTTTVLSTWSCPSAPAATYDTGVIGGGGATSPNSQAPTTPTTQAPSPTSTPFTTGAVQCSPSVTATHRAIDSSKQASYAQQACSSFSSSIAIPSAAGSYSASYEQGLYNYVVALHQGCSGQSAWYPINQQGSTTCQDILRRDYTSCNNGGLGGLADAGCVRYSFSGAYGFA